MKTQAKNIYAFTEGNPFTKKITFEELENNKNWKRAVIVYKPENWNTFYTLESRSYEITRETSRYFQENKISNSIYGTSLDKTDVGVRLDNYKWAIDYCYIVE